MRSSVLRAELLTAQCVTQDREAEGKHRRCTTGQDCRGCRGSRTSAASEEERQEEEEVILQGGALRGRLVAQKRRDEMSVKCTDSCGRRRPARNVANATV